MLVTAAKTKKSGSIRTLDPATEIQPDFMARLEPDVLLVGFETLSADDVWALGGNEDTAWWFFFAEHFTEPRFGLDQPARRRSGHLRRLERRLLGERGARRGGATRRGQLQRSAVAEVEAGHAAGTELRLARQQLVDRLDPLAVPVPPRHARHRSPAAEGRRR